MATADATVLGLADYGSDSQASDKPAALEHPGVRAAAVSGAVHPLGQLVLNARPLTTVCSSELLFKLQLACPSKDRKDDTCLAPGSHT